MLSGSFRLRKMTYLFLVAVLIASTSFSDASSEEKLLVKNLLKDYDAKVRPVSSHGTPVIVKLGIGLTDVSEAQWSSSNVFNVQGWIVQQWTDESLRWNPTEYGGITAVKMQPIVHGQPPTLWTPDITSYKGTLTPLDSTTTVRVEIQSDGRVTWVPGRNFRLRCVPSEVEAGQSKNVTCRLMLGSWVYHVRELKLQELGNTTVTNYVQNKPSDKWHLTGVDYSFDEKVFPCCPDGYGFALFTLTLTENKAASRN